MSVGPAPRGKINLIKNDGIITLRKRKKSYFKTLQNRKIFCVINHAEVPKI